MKLLAGKSSTIFNTCAFFPSEEDPGLTNHMGVDAEWTEELIRWIFLVKMLHLPK